MNSGILTTGPRASRVAGAYDALSAALAIKSGFDGIWVSSLGVTASHCHPDDGSLPSEEYFERIREISRCVQSPILFDGEIGLGDLTSTVQRCEEINIAGIAIEDRSHPRVNSFSSGRHFIEEKSSAIRRYQQAVRARRSKATMSIIARTEGLVAGESSAVVAERCRAYIGTGVDGLIIQSKDPSGRDIIDLLEHWQFEVPVLVIPTAYGMLDLSAFERLGVCSFIFANQGFRAAIAAMESVYDQIIADGNTSQVESRLIPMHALLNKFR